MFQDIFIYIILGVFAVMVSFLIFQVLKLKKRLDAFLKGKNKNLENVLKDLVERSEKVEEQAEDIIKKIIQLERISRISLQKLGVVRYNPFKEVGGDQSFSIAILDNENSGFVITSLYRNERNRIFAKPIEQGKSEYSLSEEEKNAIERAIQK